VIENYYLLIFLSFVKVGGNNNDVSHEDVHVYTMEKAGTNFGWPNCEGACDNPDFPTCDCKLHDNPMFT